MRSVEDLDTVLAVHDSAVVRSVCGSPGDESWCRFRRSVEVPGKTRRLTDKQAFMLFVRSYWRKVCKEAGATYIKSPASLDVVKVADKWVQKVHADPTVLFEQILTANTFKGCDLPRVVEELTGKVRSERTISRACKRAGLKYSRMARYGKSQIVKIVESLQR